MVVHALNSHTWDTEVDGLSARDIQDPVWKYVGGAKQNMCCAILCSNSVSRETLSGLQAWC